MGSQYRGGGDQQTGQGSADGADWSGQYTDRIHHRSTSNNSPLLTQLEPFVYYIIQYNTIQYGQLYPFSEAILRQLQLQRSQLLSRKLCPEEENNPSILQGLCEMHLPIMKVVFQACVLSALVENAAATSTANRLRVEYLRSPLTIDESIPRFSWALSHSERAQLQTAYSLVVRMM